VLYRLHNKSGDWKVYDVSIAGVSLIQTYKANFDSKVKKDGLDGLIASLDSKNQQYGN
jgi:phospholipid transport system substrate-binding protein